MHTHNSSLHARSKLGEGNGTVISLTSVSDNLPLADSSKPGERRVDFADTLLLGIMRRAVFVSWKQMQSASQNCGESLPLMCSEDIAHRANIAAKRVQKKKQVQTRLPNESNKNLLPVMSPLRLDGRDATEKPLPLLLLLASELKLSPPGSCTDVSPFFKMPAGCEAGGVVGGVDRIGTPKLAPRPATELLSPPIHPSAWPCAGGDAERARG